eukprot:CAMPEP_0182519286 /NCGR_PEP_ID=MMETSP1321-20130603/45019_1 /TAXON_ID=91990 /ORGANISM="Bolidomonas sp., Strain RCC1657" /LENGTH=51 /DNA_ID=CAMNT_0024727257 /DNA_START=1329 /DNA_END=1484 /DNA_ORIENTATION=+
MRVKRTLEVRGADFAELTEADIAEEEGEEEEGGEAEGGGESRFHSACCSLK